MRRALAAFIALAALCGAADAAQPRWRDPFARPSAALPAAPASAEGAADAAAARAPELRAILYDKAKSLVNIDGRVLALGESVGGYRLVQVDERSVTLAKAGQRIKLMLNKDSPR